MKKIIIGADPGHVNFGMWVGEVSVTKSKIQKIVTLESFMVEDTITDFKKLDSQYIGFRELLLDLKHEYKPNYCVIERFQNRGSRTGLLAECIGFMTGVFYQTFVSNTVNSTEVRLITAASWKNKVNRVFDLKQEYKQYKSLGPHRMDALLIGLSVFNNYEFLDYKHRKQLFMNCR